MYRDLFGISTDLNSHIFESIFNRVAVNRYIPIHNIDILLYFLLNKCNHHEHEILFQTHKKKSYWLRTFER